MAIYSVLSSKKVPKWALYQATERLPQSVLYNTWPLKEHLLRHLITFVFNLQASLQNNCSDLPKIYPAIMEEKFIF